VVKKWNLIPFATAIVLGGCATIPVGPTVMVLPGPGKTIEQFQADDAACRPWASQQAGTAPEGAATVQWRYDIAYQQCMYAKGNQIRGVPARDATPPGTQPTPATGGASPSPPSPLPH
jgi:hypothetical protein